MPGLHWPSWSYLNAFKNYVCGCFACIYAPSACLVPMGVSRECQVPWSGMSHTLMLGAKPQSLKSSQHFSPWTALYPCVWVLEYYCTYFSLLMFEHSVLSALFSSLDIFSFSWWNFSTLFFFLFLWDQILPYTPGCPQTLPLPSNSRSSACLCHLQLKVCSTVPGWLSDQFCLVNFWTLFRLQTPSLFWYLELKKSGAAARLCLSPLREEQLAAKIVILNWEI